MKNNNNLLEVPNINSKDAKLKKLIYEVNDSLFCEDNYSKEKFEHYAYVVEVQPLVVQKMVLQLLI